MACCHKCWDRDAKANSIQIGSSIVHPIGKPMIVCKVCGNKQCPKATDHELECTGSNEPNQEGSLY